MSELFATFGVNWKLLLIQAVNFGLLLLILWKFLYTPLMKMLDTRRTTIEEGVRNAEKAEHTLTKIESERGSIVAAATREGEGIVERARKAGSEKERQITAEAEAKAVLHLKSAEREAQELKSKALAESKAEMAKLIVLGAERVIREAK